MNFNSKNKILITGISGFTGSHLADYLLKKGCVVHGALHHQHNSENIKHLLARIDTHICDVRNEAQVVNLIKKTRPDYIFHLVAKTQARSSEDTLQSSIETNVFGTINLLEAVRSSKFDPVILVPGSSAEFGLTKNEENPVKETNPYRPVTTYAVSKIAQGMTSYQYYLKYGMKIIRTHTFNYLGPRQSIEFVAPAFAKQLAEIKIKNKSPIIKVGNLEARRDFTDVRDIVKAYWLAVRKGIPGEVYNICSCRAYSMQQVLYKLINLSQINVKIKQMQPNQGMSDVPYQSGDYSKFSALTGWKPEITIEQSLSDIMKYWIDSVLQESI
jgi:GDP-4-dehydro-6-deoxy-D-mannose reductase